MTKKRRNNRKNNRGGSAITKIDPPQHHQQRPSAQRISQKLLAAQYNYSGPVPPPEMMERWEQICPGSSDRFLKLHENQAEHRQTLEKMVVGSNIQKEDKGQNYAFVLFLVTLIGGFTITALGMSVVGMATVIAAIAAGVGLFIYGKEKGKKELREKKEEIENVQEKEPSKELKEKKPERLSDGTSSNQ